MRAVLLTTSYPEHEGDPSGHFVHAHARRLAREGHDVHVIAPGPPPRAQARPPGSGDWTIHRAGGGPLFGWPGAAARLARAPHRALLLPAFAARVAARLRALSPFDRGVAHFLLPCGWPLAAAAPGSWEAWAHGADVRLLCALPAPARRAVVEKLLASSELTFVAHALREALCAALPGPLADAVRARSRVEPPPLEIPPCGARAAAIRAALRLAPGEALVVAAGRAVAAKRFDLLLRAAALLPKGQVRVVLLGDGPERGRLVRLAASRALVAGRVPRPEALAWIAAADVLVHPSTVEAAPTVVREARVLGTRVIACGAGDVPRWAESDPGIEIVASSPEPLAAALVRRAAFGIGQRPSASASESGHRPTASGDRP